nr:ribonuclease P protein subunit P29-like isoform X1 [Ipomoea batatas]
MATDKAPGEQRKRTLEALERRFAQAETDLRRQQEHNNKKQRTLIGTTPQRNKTPSQITNTPPSSSDPSISNAPSRKGNVSFSGHSSSQDVEANHPAYFQLSHSVDGNLLSTVSEVSNSKSTVDYVLHELLQHGDSAQKYMQGSKSVKIDNYILLDNVVHKSSMSSNASLRALKSCSKRSKKHMSLKQHKKCRSFDLPPELHKKNQLAQCLLNADLHGALILG